MVYNVSDDANLETGRYRGSGIHGADGTDGSDGSDGSAVDVSHGLLPIATDLANGDGHQAGQATEIMLAHGVSHPTLPIWVEPCHTEAAGVFFLHDFCGVL